MPKNNDDKMMMELCFTVTEQDYIVNNFETDLGLTEVGLELCEGFSVVGEGVRVEVSRANYDKFIVELMSEFELKKSYLSRPDVVRGMIIRFMPNGNLRLL